MLPSGGVGLSPNALRLLEKLDVRKRLVDQGYQFESADIVTEQGVVVDRHYHGHEAMYGYKALRIARHILNRELTSMVEARHVPIRYGARLTKVIDGDGDGDDSNAPVTFEINGQAETADILVGADGIHSTTRSFICPTQQPTYTGIMVISGTVPRSEIRWSRKDHPPAAVVRGQPGGLLLVPEDPEAKTTLAGIQLPQPELDRAGWSALQASTDAIQRRVREDYDSWGDMGKSIIDAMCRHIDTVLVWPFYHIPSLATWTSPTRRVILVGDAAHAVPPSSGQGVNQAFEDVYSLAQLLRAVREDRVPFARAVDFWWRWRQGRVQKIERLAELMNIKRMSEAERKKHVDIPEEDDLDQVHTGEGQYAWLFNIDIDKELDDWINSHQT